MNAGTLPAPIDPRCFMYPPEITIDTDYHRFSALLLPICSRQGVLSNIALLTRTVVVKNPHDAEAEREAMLSV